MSEQIWKIFCYYAGFSSRKAHAKGIQAAVELPLQQFFLSVNSQNYLYSAVPLIQCQCKHCDPLCPQHSGALWAHSGFWWCCGTDQKPIWPTGGGCSNPCPKGAQRIKPNIGNCILGCIPGKSNPTLLPSFLPWIQHLPHKFSFLGLPDRGARLFKVRASFLIASIMVTAILKNIYCKKYK